MECKTCRTTSFHHRFMRKLFPEGYQQDSSMVEKGASAEKLLDFIPAAMVWLSDQQNGGSSDDIPTHRHVCGPRGHVSHSDYSSFFHSQPHEPPSAQPIHGGAPAVRDHRSKRRLRGWCDGGHYRWRAGHMAHSHYRSLRRLRVRSVGSRDLYDPCPAKR